jgi:hypothetical protein
MGYCARHMSRNRGLVLRSQTFHISISSSFWAFIKEGGNVKSRTIFLGRYSVATVEFIVGRFGV